MLSWPLKAEIDRKSLAKKKWSGGSRAEPPSRHAEYQLVALELRSKSFKIRVYLPRLRSMQGHLIVLKAIMLDKIIVLLTVHVY